MLFSVGNLTLLKGPVARVCKTAVQDCKRAYRESWTRLPRDYLRHPSMHFLQVPAGFLRQPPHLPLACPRPPLGHRAGTISHGPYVLPDEGGRCEQNAQCVEGSHHVVG